MNCYALTISDTYEAQRQGLAFVDRPFILCLVLPRGQLVILLNVGLGWSERLGCAARNEVSIINGVFSLLSSSTWVTLLCIGF